MNSPFFTSSQSTYYEDYSLSQKPQYHPHPSPTPYLYNESSTILDSPFPSVWNILKKEKTINFFFQSSLSSLPSSHSLSSTPSQISNYKKVITYYSSYLNLSLTFILISNTLEKTSLLTIQLSLKDSNSFLTANDLEHINSYLIRSITAYLKENTTSVKHYESTTIKANINSVWDFFVNWHVDKLKDKDYSNVQVEGESPHKIGTTIRFIVDDTFNMKCHVLYVDKDKDSITWRYGIKIDSCRMKASEVCFTFVKISENVTFFAYETIFNQEISMEVEEELKKKKRKLFKEVKKYFECSNYMDEGDGNGNEKMK